MFIWYKRKNKKSDTIEINKNDLEQLHFINNLEVESRKCLSNIAVCSLSFAKKLKKLGVPQKSEYYWYDCYGKDSEQLGHKDFVLTDKVHTPHYSAFTGSELEKVIKKYFRFKE
jgi:hypothetical protein